MIEYLHLDHPLIVSSVAKRNRAIIEILIRAIPCSRAFRLEVDPERLEHVLGIDSFKKLLPMPPRTKGTPSQYSVYEGDLDSVSTQLLLRVLSPGSAEFMESPVSYIECIRLLDAAGRTVFRGSDMMSSILISLPTHVRQSLTQAFAEAAIPVEILETVNVDLEALRP